MRLVLFDTGVSLHPHVIVHIELEERAGLAARLVDDELVERHAVGHDEVLLDVDDLVRSSRAQLRHLLATLVQELLNREPLWHLHGVPVALDSILAAARVVVRVGHRHLLSLDRILLLRPHTCQLLSLPLHLRLAVGVEEHRGVDIWVLAQLRLLGRAAILLRLRRLLLVSEREGRARLGLLLLLLLCGGRGLALFRNTSLELLSSPCEFLLGYQAYRLGG
mmetsp:Transcript_12854/g.26049  ORF Transcript_12854/g.26049 Transcript_12854/m.26049 type:complete len:221 (-) Transcript_12854:55-717(-)